MSSICETGCRDFVMKGYCRYNGGLTPEGSHVPRWQAGRGLAGPQCCRGRQRLGLGCMLARGRLAEGLMCALTFSEGSETCRRVSKIFDVLLAHSLMIWSPVAR